MGTKTVNFNSKGIGKLPNDKPVMYRIETDNGKLNYAGIAKRGRVQEHIAEHLSEMPGAKVKIEQFSSIDEARSKEERVIKINQPKYNEQGK
ncbi:hypothetical protein HY745_13115 [Candidatus Desantisbacteria bacterium]|nr:hypothetical protein [Candidatus Desantisbacteria bacterium]